MIGQKKSAEPDCHYSALIDNNPWKVYYRF